MSNPMENAQKLGQKLFEIQTKTITQLASMQQQNVQKFMDMNREFTNKMTEVRDPQDVMALQREMAETLWNNYQESNQNTGELVREAWEEVGAAYTDAFSGNTDK